MTSFAGDVLARQAVSVALASRLAALTERRLRFFYTEKERTPALGFLREAARIDTEAACKERRDRKVQGQKVVHIARADIDAKAYVDAYSAIDAALPIPPRARDLALLHARLCPALGARAGRYKLRDNHLFFTAPSGRTRPWVKTVAAPDTARAMLRLHRGLARVWQSPEVDRTLAIGAYVVDLVTIHPFDDGNGRLSRLAATALCIAAGHEVLRYVSLERHLAKHRDDYFLALRASQRGWLKDAQDLQPFWRFFVEVLLGCYDELYLKLLMI